jgi:hypothetical protein
MMLFSVSVRDFLRIGLIVVGLRYLEFIEL